MQVHKLIADVKPAHATIRDYDLNGFDHTLLWTSQFLPADALQNVRLYVSTGRTYPDFLCNPLSWLLCSERMHDFISSSAGTHVQTLDCSILDAKGAPIKGYKVVNVLTKVKALNLDESDFSEDEDGIDVIYDWVFDIGKIPHGNAAFREERYRYSVFLTDCFARSFPEMSGFAFVACKAV